MNCGGIVIASGGAACTPGAMNTGAGVPEAGAVDPPTVDVAPVGETETALETGATVASGAIAGDGLAGTMPGKLPPKLATRS